MLKPWIKGKQIFKIISLKCSQNHQKSFIYFANFLKASWIIKFREISHSHMDRVLCGHANDAKHPWFQIWLYTKHQRHFNMFMFVCHLWSHFASMAFRRTLLHISYEYFSDFSHAPSNYVFGCSPLPLVAKITYCNSYVKAQKWSQHISIAPGGWLQYRF